MSKQEYIRNWKLAHPEKVLALQRKYRSKPEVKAKRKLYDYNYTRQLRMKVLGHYSNGALKCAHCGEVDLEVLCLDHINGRGNQQRRETGKSNGNGFYRWIITNSYPEGFQVLCANCNIRKYHKESRESQ